MVALGFCDKAKRDHSRHCLIGVVMATTEFINDKPYTSEPLSELPSRSSHNTDALAIRVTDLLSCTTNLTPLAAPPQSPSPY